MIEIVRRKSDNVVIHAGFGLVLTAEGLRANRAWNPQLNTGSCELLEVESIPEYFQSGWYTYTILDGFQLTEFGHEELVPILSNVVTDKKADIAAERNRRIAVGMTYPFPDGSGPVQMSRDEDLRNLQTIAIRALGMVQMGDNTTQISIWDAAGTEHLMTGAQAAEFSEYVGAWGESCYKVAANIHEAVVDAIAKDETLTGLERIAQINAYDFSGSWPE